ncbi:MAG TPA: 5-formyltetrahydrofolate cyclo-ligase [Rhodospirillaceae bacterium]|jgi:5-formyltetrahydrofolate cyclo-ligase|nr:5-formyltetrahydrofolate cyclo-ligase [Alphaproteobacteria bacterium]HBH25776.1 5-formyltetrahydrofolate cyclo-ligase [Rhodospirillaceae bacterium]
MDKEALRAEARRVRAARARAGDALDAAEAALGHLLGAIAPQAGCVVAGYVPVGAEFDALTVLEGMVARGCSAALPVAGEGTRILRFAPWAAGDPMARGPHGALEPTSREAARPGMVLVPLLAFDRRGSRLGQGGGHYDATLAALRASGPPVLAVGLAWAEQACLFPLPAEPHDARLDWVVTPEGAMRF